MASITVVTKRRWFFYPCFCIFWFLAATGAAPPEKLAGFMIRRCMKWGIPK